MPLSPTRNVRAPDRAPLRPSGSPRGRWAAFLLALLVLAAAPDARAQLARDPAGAYGSISGVVIDAVSAEPVAHARVELELLHADDSNGERYARALRGGRTARTDSLGTYLFPRVPPGGYRVRVSRPGYAGATVDVHLDGPVDRRVTLGLEFRPVALQTIEVVGLPAQPYARTRAPAAVVAGARTYVARQRQAAHLQTDARELTSADVAEAITLAEPDVFRALQRVPGVGTRDDYTATLWVRGAPWAQTRVYFDGLPLYNPTHAGWLFSSINPSAIGEAEFLPGVRSAEWGEGAAGILSLRSRRGRDARMGASGELSLASMQASLDGPLPRGGSWMVAARRTYVDLLTGAWEVLGIADSVHIPYDFSDLSGRVDLPVAAGVRLEASGLAENDRLRGDIPGILERNHGRWGNRAGRITLAAPVGGLELRATVGATRFATMLYEDTLRAPDDARAADPEEFTSGPATLATLESEIDHDLLAVRLAPAVPGARIRWAVGAGSVRDLIRYDGPLSLVGQGLPRPSPSGEGEPRFVLAPTELRYDVLWGEWRVSPVEQLQVEMGVRLEMGDSMPNAGEVRSAPRVAVRWQPVPAVGLSAAWGRSYQYTQVIGATGGPVGPQLHVGNLWLVAGIFPALRSEILTMGAEAWLAEGWLLTSNVYRRSSDGITEPDPLEGPLPDPGRRRQVPGENEARGAELSLRRLAGRWTASLGYAYGESEMRVDTTYRYPSSADVRHALDATASLQWSERLRVGSAFSYSSGVPYTRILAGDPPILGAANAQRTPSYASLDLLVDHTSRIRGWDVAFYLQLRNAFGRDNRVTYSGSYETCDGAPVLAGVPCEGARGVHDDFAAGLPRLPLIGARITLP